MPWPVDRATREDNTKAMAGYLHAVLDWLNTPRTPPDWSARVLMRDGRRWVRVEERAAAIGKSPEPFILTAGRILRRSA